MELRAGELVAQVVADSFLRIESLVCDGRELLVGPDELPPWARVHGRHAGITFLHPWANRLRADSFSVAGAVVVLDGGPAISRDANGVALHGLPGEWRLERIGPGSAEALLHHESVEAFPFPHCVRVWLALSDDERRVSIATTVRASGDVVVPVSFGWHPYFRVGGRREEWELTLPGGCSEPLGTRVLDDGFDQIAPGERLAIGDVRVVFESGYPHAQVFAPREADVVSLEPMTAPTNALVSGEGLRLLQPGEEFTARYVVEVA